MSTKDNGGPAFPTDPNTQPGFYQHHGMSLRDWFAGQALAGILAFPGAVDANRDEAREAFGKFKAKAPVARAAYTYADAMIAERSK